MTQLCSAAIPAVQALLYSLHNLAIFQNYRCFSVNFIIYTPRRRCVTNVVTMRTAAIAFCNSASPTTLVQPAPHWTHLIYRPPSRNVVWQDLLSPGPADDADCTRNADLVKYLTAPVCDIVLVKLRRLGQDRRILQRLSVTLVYFR